MRKEKYSTTIEIHENIYLSCDVVVESGGSCGYNSVEPPWTDIEIKNETMCYWNGDNINKFEFDFTPEQVKAYVEFYYDEILEEIQNQ